MGRLVSRLHDEVAGLEGHRDAVDVPIERLRASYESFTAELIVDEELAAEHRAADNPSSVAG